MTTSQPLAALKNNPLRPSATISRDRGDKRGLSIIHYKKAWKTSSSSSPLEVFQDLLRQRFAELRTDYYLAQRVPQHTLFRLLAYDDQTGYRPTGLGYDDLLSPIHPIQNLDRCVFAS